MATNNEKIASEIIRELALQEKYKIDLRASSRRVEELRKSIKDSYPKFISDSIKESPNKFVYKERFPTTEEIRSFYQYGDINNISLYDYGWFDIKELAAIIKTLYSLKKQKEYSIVTLANLEEEYFGPVISDRKIVPYLNFLIGLDQKHIAEYNGKYFDEPSLEGNILDKYNFDRHQGLVRLKQDRKYDKKFKSFEFNSEGVIAIHPISWYLDPLINWNDNTAFFSQYNIFDKYSGEVIRRLDNEPRKNIGALLSFSLDFQDNFIAKTLMSIVIYKKKTNKLELDNNDYKYIFYELFKEDVDVLDIVDKEIPKVLTRYK